MLNRTSVSTMLCVFILLLGACDEAQPSEPGEEQEAAVEAVAEQASEEPEATEEPEVIEEATEVPIEVLAADMEILDTDGVFADIVYTVTLRNPTSERVTVRANVEYLDADGEAVGTAAWFNRTVEAGDDKTFSEEETAADAARSIQVTLTEW